MHRGGPGMLHLAGSAITQYSVQDLWDLEYGAILNASDPCAKLRETGDDLLDPAANFLEGVEHDASAVFLDPFGVVPLLRHGPGIVDDDDRQTLLYGFADAPRAGF